VRNCTEEFEHAERKRRTAAVRKGEAIARQLGFIEIANRKGFWSHDSLPGEIFELTTEHSPLDSVEDAVELIFHQGRRQGIVWSRTALRSLVGL